MKRDWTAARAKVNEEGRCRVCARPVGLEAAHIIQRARVAPGPGEDPRNIVPLDGRCHRMYDGRELDLLPYLSVDEQSYAVLVAGSLIAALERVTNQRWAPAGESAA